MEVKASFRVNKVRVIQSNIQYALLLLSDRMVFAKIGGQFADGGLAGSIIGGAVGGALGGLIASSIEQDLQKSSTSKKKDEKIKSLSEMSIEEVLNLDKNNFELHYNEIITVEMKKSSMSFSGARSGVLSIEGKKKEAFDLAPNQDYERCYRSISTFLPGKVK